jgi:gliding motility-associated-like protein
LQCVSAAEAKYNIVLTLYLDEASHKINADEQHANLFKNDGHWKDSGRWVPFGFYALKRTSSIKLQQTTSTCSDSSTKSIVREIYETTVIFANRPNFLANSFLLAWCPLAFRNEPDLNVQNENSFQEFVVAVVPPILEDANLENSSPAIGDINTFNVCKDELTTIQLPVIDRDGDVLKFFLSKPFGAFDHNNGRIDNVDLDWADGYSDTNQMSGSPGLSIDENTGVMKVEPDKPGQYFIGVSVEEYRNGEKLGTVELYYTLTVVDCKEQLDLDTQIYRDTSSVLNLAICVGTEVTLESKQTFKDPQPEFQWTKNGKTIWGANSQSITISDEGEYQLVTTKIDGCPDSFDSEVVHVNVISSGAEIDTVFAVCNMDGQPIPLKGRPSGGTFSGLGVVGNTFDARIAGVGRHEIEYTLGGSGACPTSVAKREIIVSEPPVLDLVDVLYTSRNKSISIGVKDSLDLLYQWLPSTYLNNEYYANPISTPAADIKYTLVATNKDGCPGSREMRIKIIENILIPDAFTPNSDGINETWELKGIEGYPNCHVTIYSRWGEVIFNSIGYQTPFDGTVAGALQMPGVYAYKIRLTENSPELTGALTLIR